MVNSACDWHLGTLRPGAMLTVFHRAICLRQATCAPALPSLLDLSIWGPFLWGPFPGTRARQRCGLLPPFNQLGWLTLAPSVHSMKFEGNEQLVQVYALPQLQQALKVRPCGRVGAAGSRQRALRGQQRGSGNMELTMGSWYWCPVQQPWQHSLRSLARRDAPLPCHRCWSVCGWLREHMWPAAPRPPSPTY